MKRTSFDPWQCFPVVGFLLVSACAKPPQYVESADAASDRARGSAGAGGASGSAGVSTGGSSGSGAGSMAMEGTPVDAPTADSAAHATDAVEPDSGPTGVGCGEEPGQRCCESASKSCSNNCGTTGVMTCKDGAYGVCSVVDACCGDASCSNNCGETASRTCSGTVWGPCPASTRACCPGDTMPCSNNCGTAGARSCSAGIYGACSAANTCCGDRSCSNNCGEQGTRSCSGTTLGACPVPMRACCPGDTRSCSNVCGMAGTISCRNNQYNASDCTAKDAACEGGRGQPCRSGDRCDSGLFCCPNPGICEPAELKKCIAQRGLEGKCDYSSATPNCGSAFYCDGDSDTCQPKRGVGGTCFDTPGTPKCEAGLRCDPATNTCV